MANTADETALSQVMDVTSLRSEEDKTVFREALKAHNNNTEALVIEYFNLGPEPFKQKYTLWDEGPFLADRDGSTNPSFQIQGPDQTGQEVWAGMGAGLGAPSRPPSRAHNRSPMDTSPLGAPTTQQQADEQLRIAMQESLMQVPGSATPQESGIIAAGSVPMQQFGPANRPHYEEDEWAVVKASKTSEDPPAPARQRENDVPVFLACRSPQRDQKHRLGPLMMMMHEIPAARNFFLLLQGASMSYGNNKEWWRGSNITTMGANDQIWGNDAAGVSLVDELQRLIAFLGETDRAYGTADSLVANHLIRNAWGDPTVKFYESLYNSSASQELIRMWTKVKVEDSALDESRPQEFAILEFKITNDTLDVFRSLYSQWDCLFWLQQENGWEDRQNGGLSQIASIQVPAQVMTMRISTDGLPIEVPEVLYIDRYLESNVEAARVMQNKMFHMWQAIDKASEYESKHSQWTNPKTGQSIDRVKLNRAVIDKSEVQIWRIRADALWRMHEKSVGTEDEIPYLPDELNHLAELNEEEQKAVRHFEAEIALAKLAMAKVDKKLARIRAEKDACCALLRQLKEAWTTPSEDPKFNPTHKYTLRGVITSPDVIYMYRRSLPEPFDESDEVVDRWYRVAWMPDSDNRVKQEQTTIEKVKEVMFTDRNADGSIAPILVYATDEALKDTPLHLSSALQTFIKFDNRLFKQEQIEDNSQRDKKRVVVRGSQSPPKRQRSDSADSMATNRASIGDLSDGEDRAALLADQFEHFGDGDGMETEMADMRPISEDEIAAHMPPLTPPLSDGDASELDSLGLRRSSERLAELSLDDGVTLNGLQPQGVKGPEMEELKQPFIVRRPASALDNRVSIIERPMEIDANLEIPGVSPEEYYHQSC